MDIAPIIAAGAAAAYFSNIITNALKASPVPSPTIVLPIVAFLTAEGCAFLLFIAGGGVMNGQNAAITALVGVAAFGGASGAKLLSDLASPPRSN